MSIREARSALMVTLEVMWGFGLAALVVRMFSEHRPGPSLIAITLVVLVASALSYLWPADDEDTPPVPIAAALIILAVIALVAQVEYAAEPWSFGWIGSLTTHGATVSSSERGIVAGVAMLALLAVRGAGAAARADSAESALASVLFGLALVALAAIVSPRERGPDLFGPLAIAYVPLALVALATYQVPDPDRPLRETLAQSGRWLGALIAVMLVIALVAAAIDPRSLGVLAPIGRPPLFVAGIVLKVLLAPFAIVVALASYLPSLPHHHPPPQPDMQLQPSVERAHDTPEWQIIAGRVIAGMVVALVVSLVLALIWIALRRLRPRKRTAIERRETIEDEQTLGDDLGDLFGGLLRRFRRPPRTAIAAVAVRRLYHDMLADAAGAGIERRPSMTPLQFAPSLDAHYRSDAPSAISGAFTRSRYGRIEFDEATVTALRQRWQAARDDRGP